VANILGSCVTAVTGVKTAGDLVLVADLLGVTVSTALLGGLKAAEYASLRSHVSDADYLEQRAREVEDMAFTNRSKGSKFTSIGLSQRWTSQMQ